MASSEGLPGSRSAASACKKAKSFAETEHSRWLPRSGEHPFDGTDISEGSIKPWRSSSGDEQLLLKG